jgi:Arc/MetJ-type ribon-helix-helix transcriptional regulator
MRKEVREMGVKKLVERLIPREELENVDELVSEGYYGSRNEALKDILRRGAAAVRLRFL